MNEFMRWLFSELLGIPLEPPKPTPVPTESQSIKRKVFPMLNFLKADPSALPGLINATEVANAYTASALTAALVAAGIAALEAFLPHVATLIPSIPLAYLATYAVTQAIQTLLKLRDGQHAIEV